MARINQFLNENANESNKDDAFEFNDEVEIKSNKTLKINNSKSSVPQQNIQTPNINNNISKILESEEEQKKIAFTLTTKLLSMMRDKTLDENKDKISRDEEKKVISEYVNFARLINSDPSKEESLGTLSLVTAMTRCVLVQRDRINELEYESQKLRKAVEKLLVKEASK
ncbi:MAG: hypothetical protein ACOYMA_00135 [Bacteroidia bacterium]